MTAEDLKGKRVMGEIPASQALTAIDKAIIASGGLTVDDVEFMMSGGLMDGINAVVEGRDDAAPVATTMPVLVESNASVDGGLRLVAVGSMASDEFFAEQVAGLSGGLAEENANRPFIRGNTPIVSYDSMLIGSDGLTDDDAYQLAKVLHENWAKLQADVGPLRATPPENLALAASPIPYHPGAIKFYKEIGIWTDAHEANQNKF